MNKLFEDYEDTFHSPGGKLVSQFEIEKVIHLFNNPSKKFFLDIGTGTGRVARSLLSLGNDVVGLDVSSDRLSLALKKYKNLKTEQNYHLLLADAQYLPFKKEVFDNVLSIRVLKYLKNSKMGFSEISRVIKNKGLCVLELSNIFGYESLWLFLFKLLGKGKQYAENMGAYYHLFNIFEVIHIFRSLELVVISKKSWHKIPTVFFIKCKQPIMLKILLSAECVFQKVFPFFLFSRGTLIKAVCVRKKAQVYLPKH